MATGLDGLRLGITPRHTEELVVDEGPLEGVALCLSGGGYRGMLFSVGSLWRLNELGRLPDIACISSVSGATIAAATLAAAWHRLDFDRDGVARRFVDEVVQPVRRLARESVDLWSIAGAELSRSTVAEIVANAYDECMFSGLTLADLPDADPGRVPEFVFSALNIQSGELVRLSKACITDGRVGRIDRPRLRLGLAVAAASAFPPMMPPVTLEFDDSDYSPGSGADLQHAPFTTRPALIDAGVLDSLALDFAWQCRTLLVSDGGGYAAPESELNQDWFPVAARLMALTTDRNRQLRAYELHEAFALPRHVRGASRRGAYWSLRSEIDSGPSNQPLSTAERAELATGPVRLEAIPGHRQEQLIKWGYAACDGAIRAELEESALLQRISRDGSAQKGGGR